MNGKPTIAIVDDELDICMLLMSVFQRSRMSVCFVASDAPDAIEKFNRADPKPSVMIVDNRLPSMSGLDLMREVLAVEPKTKIVFVSGDHGIEQDMVVAAGAAAFLKKPASIKTIMDTVNRLMEYH
jgi:DNA-binding NtrC family response regulator